MRGKVLSPHLSDEHQLIFDLTKRFVVHICNVTPLKVRREAGYEGAVSDVA
jgi:hypothetical protein